MKNKLTNPTWYSLYETHKKWCVEFNNVKFYNPEICPFGAFFDETKTAEALNKYAKLTNEFFLVSENQTPTFDKDHVILDQKIEGCQMVLDDLTAIEITEDIIKLSKDYIDEIYDLVWLVMPGYYRKQTFNMGNFYGIFKDNKLISIAGQRMQMDAYIEVSSVVTHPGHTRKGYAKQLTAFATKEILKTGKTPILHTTKGNPAIKLYEKLGYKLTRDMNWWFFKRK